MKLLLLQTDIRRLAPDENRRRAGAMIDEALGAGASGAGGAVGSVDLIVLPEMFTTGFETEPAGAVEPVDDPDASPTLTWMRATAARTGAAVAGSVAVAEGDRYFNRFYFVRPDGSHDQYDKRHLFSLAGEHLRYTAGRRRTVVEWRGVRILLQVCYDLRFPVFARNRGGGRDGGPDYDMILYVASWPTVRIHPWNTLLRARAIENVCFAAGVNRVGTDQAGAYCGGTALIDFKGETVAAAAPEREDAVICEIDPEALRTFRARFPALSDADEFELKI